MNLIVAVDNRWAIGHKNRLLNSIPEDMKFFQNVTKNKVVIMGRKTLESLPNGLPLAMRTNIVLSKNPACQVRGAQVAHSVQEVLEMVADYDTNDVYVIGGAEIYRALLPYCNVAHVTKMDYNYEADAWFPDIDADEDWKMLAESEERTYFDLEYYFRLYVRKSSLKDEAVQAYIEDYMG